jgi:hypothetical protein
VPDLLIAAIARIADNAELEALLTECTGLDASRIIVFKTDHVRDVPARLRTHFIPSDQAPVAAGSHGTNVPGMGATLALNAYVADAAGVDRFKGIGISPDTAHYYNIAIDEGRSVVTYVTSVENATLVEEQFRACGFVKIRRFPVVNKFAVECGSERT